jgi:hypothetical protein
MPGKRLGGTNTLLRYGIRLVDFFEKFGFVFLFRQRMEFLTV